MRPEINPEAKAEAAASRARGYAKSAEYAGKMLMHLCEADCATPSVVLFGDGSGHFVVNRADQPTADEVFKRFLGKVPYKSPSRGQPPEIEYIIDFNTFDAYQEACPECKRPL